MSLSPGRPRALDADERLTAAAVELYAGSGWERLSLASAAQRAGLGKSSAYLRWASKGELLADGFDRYGAHVEDVDTGAIHTDLVALALSLHSVFSGPMGAASLRLLVDAQLVPELKAVETKIRDTQIAAARRIVQRGIARGEVPASTSISLVLNAVCGGILNWVVSRPPESEAHTEVAAQRFSERLVALVLAGLRCDIAAQ